jgi:hypothetical protein
MQTNVVRELLAHLYKPLQVLCIESAMIANRHFDSYIKGTYPGSLRPHIDMHLPTTPATPATPITLSPLAIMSPLTTYAQVMATSGPPKALYAHK